MTRNAEASDTAALPSGYEGLRAQVMEAAAEISDKLSADHADRLSAVIECANEQIEEQRATITRLTSELAASRERERALEQERDDLKDRLTFCEGSLEVARQPGIAVAKELIARAQAAEAEVKRLRRALDEIAGGDVIYPPHDPGSYMPPQGKDGPFRTIALRALADANTQGGDNAAE